MSSACSAIGQFRGLLGKVGFPQSSPMSLHADNTSAVKITKNRIFHEKAKHIEIECHYIKQKIRICLIDD